MTYIDLHKIGLASLATFLHDGHGGDRCLNVHFLLQ